MSTVKLKLTKEYEIDLVDEDMRQILEEALTLNGITGPSTPSELHDAIKQQLGDDMASLIDLDSITDEDFTITVTDTNGLSGNKEIEA